MYKEIREKAREEFEEYLMEVCFEDNPQILDDDQPDFFDTWLTEQDIDTMIGLGNAYGNKVLIAERERLKALDKLIK